MSLTLKQNSCIQVMPNHISCKTVIWQVNDMGQSLMNRWSLASLTYTDVFQHIFEVSVEFSKNAGKTSDGLSVSMLDTNILSH